MGKEILTSADIEIESPILLKVVDIETLLLSNLTSFGEITISTLLVTCIMMIILSHNI